MYGPKHSGQSGPKDRSKNNIHLSSVDAYQNHIIIFALTTDYTPINWKV